MLKAHFGRSGIPSTLISDNGPPFTAAQFQTFLSEWEIQHHTSAPGLPNANGKAEIGVKAAKQMMEKGKRSNTNPFMALLEIRTTPTQGAGSSPSQRLINRRTRILLPITRNLLRPRGALEHECDKLKVKHSHTMQTTYYNRRAKDLFVDSFTYLGSLITNDGSSSRNITYCTAKAASAMYRLSNPLFRKHPISIQTKINMYRALVVSVLLYDSGAGPPPSPIAGA